jgi:hypothetical protein
VPSFRFFLPHICTLSTISCVSEDRSPLNLGARRTKFQLNVTVLLQWSIYSCPDVFLVRHIKHPGLQSQLTNISGVQTGHHCHDGLSFNSFMPQSWWMASWESHPVLWSCHLGRRRVLGLLHPYIHMLDCIIRLQAVAEIITNETARALNLLAKQSTRCTMPSIKTTCL